MAFALDKRGGHNRKTFDYTFFKTWSPKMAYILGFAFADGTVIDAKLSRTCYFRLYSTDEKHLVKINQILNRKGKIYTSKPREIKKGCKTYIPKMGYYISIGSRELFSDLIALGLSQRKSWCARFPVVPENYLPHFMRGYFDGDGCIYIDKNNKKLQVIFTSGSKDFLEDLYTLLSNQLRVDTKTIFRNSGAFQIRYSTKEALKILAFMYEDLESSLCLERKWLIYQKWRGTQVGRGLPAKQL